MAIPAVRTVQRAIAVVGQALPQPAAPLYVGRPSRTGRQPLAFKPAVAGRQAQAVAGAELARRALKISQVQRRAADDFGRYRELLTRAAAGRQSPSLAQLASATIVAAGAGLNVVGNAITGGAWDPGLFDDGQPWAGQPVPASLVASAAGGAGPRRLQDLGAMIDQAKAARLPGITVTCVNNPGEPERFIVSVPGTQQPLHVFADQRPFDGTGNLRGMAGQTCATATAIGLAMENAGIPAGAEVLLNGHSQGGIQAAALASDQAFTSRYDLRVVLTYGAPIEGFRFDPRAQVVALCNPTDWIQALDLKAFGADHLLRERGNFTEYWLPGPTKSATGPLADHGMAQYRDAIGREEGTGGELDQLILARGIGRFLLREAGQAATVFVPVARRY